MAVDVLQQPPLRPSSTPQNERWDRPSTSRPLSRGHHSADPPRWLLPSEAATSNQPMPFALHWCLLCACNISQYVLPSVGLKKSRTAPMSSTRKAVLDGMILHCSFQKALFVFVVPATFATSDMPVFGGSGWRWMA